MVRSFFGWPGGWDVLTPGLFCPRDPAVRMKRVYGRLAGWVAKRDAPVITVAGDCLSAIAVQGGLQARRVDTSLVWFDAHGDFHTHDTTPSGHLGGMPLAMLMGQGDQRFMEVCGARPVENVLHVGGRDFDAGERVRMEQAGVRFANSAGGVAGDVHVHIDVDVLDPGQMPSVRYPAPDGMTASALLAKVAKVFSTSRVAAVSVSSYDPTGRRGDEADSEELLCKLMRAVELMMEVA